MYDLLYVDVMLKTRSLFVFKSS